MSTEGRSPDLDAPASPSGNGRGPGEMADEHVRPAGEYVRYRRRPGQPRYIVRGESNADMYNRAAMRVKRGSQVARFRRRRVKKKDGVGQAMRVALFLTPFFLLLLILGTVTMGLQAAAAIGRDVPTLPDQRIELAQTSRIYAASGDLLAYLHGVENRQVIGSERIPQVVKDAVVAIEDERFYQHEGVDLQGIARALLKDLQAGEIVEGASTITQQLVGTLYLDRTDTSFTRKFHEAALALQFEEKMSKDEILDLYLNTVYFGSNAYGVLAASRTYFNKDPGELSLPEAALLAGLPQRPTAYSPRENPEQAVARRNLVLQSMFVNGFIDFGEYQEAMAAPLQLAEASPYTRVQEPYVVAYVRKQLIDMFGEDLVFKGGLTVETTINPAYQEHAERAIKESLGRPGDPSAALVAIETSTGYIRAMVGGTDYDKSKFNLAAQGRRQPGSAFKTFALTAAVEMGMNPATTYYTSMPLSIPIAGSRRPWNVKTFGNDYYGASSLVQATLRSDNTVYAQLAMDVGAERMADVAKRMGIKTEINKNPAIVLGGLTYGVTPMEMASAYATLARGGKAIEPTVIRKVWNSQGELLYDATGNDKPQETQAISAGVAYVVTDILKQNIQRGTGARYGQLGRPAAGKTGTAQDYRDAWFAGYTPQLSTAVWVGHPEAQIEMRNVHGIRVTGGSFPTMIWGKFMRTVIADFPVKDFEKPQEQVVFNYKPKQSQFQVTRQPTRTTSNSGQGSGSTLAPPISIPPTSNPPSTAPPTTQPPATEPPATEPPAPVSN